MFLSIMSPFFPPNSSFTILNLSIFIIPITYVFSLSFCKIFSTDVQKLSRLFNPVSVSLSTLYFNSIMVFFIFVSAFISSVRSINTTWNVLQSSCFASILADTPVHNMFLFLFIRRILQCIISSSSLHMISLKTSSSLA